MTFWGHTRTFWGVLWENSTDFQGSTQDERIFRGESTNFVGLILEAHCFFAGPLLFQGLLFYGGVLFGVIGQNRAHREVKI